MALGLLAEHCSLLHTLDVSRCHSVTDVGIEALAAGCRGLSSLQLEG